MKSAVSSNIIYSPFMLAASHSCSRRPCCAAAATNRGCILDWFAICSLLYQSADLTGDKLTDKLTRNAVFREMELQSDARKCV